MINQPKLIFSDVDNTLVISKRGFTDEMVEAFKYCNEHDIEFIMCSGRPTTNLIIEANLLKQRGIKLNFVAGFNASELYDLNTNSYIYQEALEADEVEFIAGEIKKLNLDYLFYKDKTIFASDVNNEWILHEYEITKLDSLQEVNGFNKTAKVLGVCNPGSGDQAVSDLKKVLKDYTITLSTDFFIEITKKGVDKGFGLVKTAQMLGIDQKDIICFGDGGNDLNMFKTDAFGVGVLNATNEIKDNAKLIIDSCENDGVAKFILNGFKA